MPEEHAAGRTASAGDHAAPPNPMREILVSLCHKTPLDFYRTETSRPDWNQSISKR